MLCTYCSSENSAGSRWCSSCGLRLPVNGSSPQLVEVAAGRSSAARLESPQFATQGHSGTAFASVRQYEQRDFRSATSAFGERTDATSRRYLASVAGRLKRPAYAGPPGRAVSGYSRRRSRISAASWDLRALAALLDAAVVLAAVLLFFAIPLLWVRGGILMNSHGVALLLTVTVLFAWFYRVLWCIANVDSPGMRLAGIRLADFAGGPPGRRQRSLRHAVGWLSLACGGLGFVSAIYHTPRLAWHDRHSRTFFISDPSAE